MIKKCVIVGTVIIGAICALAIPFFQNQETQHIGPSERTATSGTSKFNGLADDCLQTKRVILNSPESKHAIESFTTEHPEAVQYWREIKIEPTADWECEIRGQPVTSIVYNLKSTKPHFGFNQTSHTHFVFFDTSRTKIQKTIEVVCPFGDDTKSAELKNANGDLALVECSSFSSMGAMSGISFTNYEFHIVNLAENSKKMVFQKTIMSEQGQEKVLSYVDETEGIPESFSTEIFKHNP